MLATFTSLIDNYKTKIRNPFIGTFASVWLIRNWVVVYAFFMFDEDCTMQDKINYISNYFSRQSFWIELGLNLLIVFGVLLLTYILYAISRALTNLYYKIVEPFIINFIDRKEVVTREEKKIMLQEIAKLTLDLESARENNSKIEARNRSILEGKKTALVDFQNKETSMSEDIQQMSDALNLLEIQGREGKLLQSKLHQVLIQFEGRYKKSLLTYIRMHDFGVIQKVQFNDLQSHLIDRGIIIEADKSKNSLISQIFLENFRKLHFLENPDEISATP